MKKPCWLNAPLFQIPMLALVLGALGGCAATRIAQSDWQTKIPPGCNVAEVQFARHGGPRLLVLHVSGLEPPTAAKLAGGVREALLGSIAEKRQSRLWRKTLPPKMQAAELHCAVTSHGQAFWVGQVSGADAVLWGTLRERASGEQLASVAPEASAAAPAPDTIAFHLTPVRPMVGRSPFKRVVDFPPVPWLTRLPEEQGEIPAMKIASGTVGPGPFNPGNQPVPCYLGKEVHKAIGIVYQVAHPNDDVFLNTFPISGILLRLRLPLPHGISRTVLAARPDIYNASRQHLYEIKPLSRSSEAIADAVLYQMYLAKVGLAVSLGPPGEPGTQGVLPAPKGYVVFNTPMPGVIAYYCADGQYRYAPETSTAPAPQAEPAVTKNQQTTQPSPQIPPTPHPAKPWWKQGDLLESVEAATGLTGGALVVYLIVSEGLRIVLPVRNFVPVP
jgi:hypothetical protein